MTTNAQRAEVLERALRARVEGKRGNAEQLYTEDVKAWTPAFSTSSRGELLAEFDRTDDAFSDIALDVTTLDVGGDFACAEWTVTAAPAAAPRDAVTKLKDAAALHEAGVLTDEEFAAAKAKVLAEDGE